MKVNIEIDCTPEEARAFMGLPDMTSLHAVYLDCMQTLMSEGITASDVEKLVGNWIPGAAHGFEQFQKAMWGAIGATSGSDKPR